MAKTTAFHRIKQNVHHNSTTCTEGNNIEKENKRSRTGGKPYDNEKGFSHIDIELSDGYRYGKGIQYGK